jgi:16S rRNA (guanine527-N7)-methyltransferase
VGAVHWAGSVRDMPVNLSPDHESILRAFSEAVKVSPHNLVSRRAREELWERHVLESVAFAAMLPKDARLLDVGSGGGFPGVVIAVVRPDIDVTLLEASAKKVGFLTSIAGSLGIDFQVLHGRAEDIRQAQGADRFSVVTARAVAPLPRLLGWTMPFLAPGGLLYAIKGAAWEDELRAAASELAKWRGEVVATPNELPSAVGTPMVIVIRRGVGL